jgi:transporter family protein
VDKLSVAIAILLALVFLGEKLTWKVALGGTLITLGSIVMAFA